MTGLVLCNMNRDSPSREPGGTFEEYILLSVFLVVVWSAALDGC